MSENNPTQEAPKPANTELALLPSHLRDEDNREQFIIRDGVKLYLKENGSSDPAETYRWYCPQFRTGKALPPAPTPEQVAEENNNQVALLNEIVSRFGAELAVTATNDYIKRSLLIKVKNKLPSANDKEEEKVQRRAYIGSIPNGIIFGEDKALEYKPGEREITPTACFKNSQECSAKGMALLQNPASTAEDKQRGKELIIEAQNWIVRMNQIMMDNANRTFAAAGVADDNN